MCHLPESSMKRPRDHLMLEDARCCHSRKEGRSEQGRSLQDRQKHLIFFFSSRRRHTRSYGDWSSDVCSSDLYRNATASVGIYLRQTRPRLASAESRREEWEKESLSPESTIALPCARGGRSRVWVKIGRASCREIG